MTGNVQAVSQVGTTVADKYRLLRVLGIGGMGVVYEAQHAVTHRRVALKMMHNWVAESSPQAGTRFLREAQAAASIGHPAIVDVLDAGQLDGGALYLVFEMLDGRDLEAALAGDELTTGDIISIAIDVLGGLEAAHSRGFVHRDIKPANVFLSKNHAGAREVKLLDFGIAKRVDAGATFTGITAHGSIVGTLEYMSPEQASAHVVDGRTDLWALGALMHRALAGQPPFAGRNQLELVTAILLAPVPSLGSRRPDLPASLVSIVDRALKRERDERWASAAAMRDALAALDHSGLPRALPPAPLSGDQTPAVPQPREEVTPQDREIEDFAANEPTRRAVIPTPPRGLATGPLSSSEIPAIREEPTEISKQRDIVTMVVRESDVDGAPETPEVTVQPLDEGPETPEVTVQPVLRQTIAPKLTPIITPVFAQQTPSPELTPVLVPKPSPLVFKPAAIPAAPIPTEPIGAADTTGAQNTQILLDASLQDEALLAKTRRSRSGRWTFAALLLLTACATGAWLWNNERGAISDRPSRSNAMPGPVQLVPATEQVPVNRVQAVERPVIAEPMPVPPPVAPPVEEQVEAKVEAMLEEIPAVEEPRAPEKKEKKRAKTKRAAKKVSERPAPQPQQPEPAKKVEGDFFYREDHL